MWKIGTENSVLLYNNTESCIMIMLLYDIGVGISDAPPVGMTFRFVEGEPDVKARSMWSFHSRRLEAGTGVFVHCCSLTEWNRRPYNNKRYRKR